MGKRGRKPLGRVKCVWSANMAYAVGLIATDGCLLGNGKNVTFVSKDLAQIETFLRCIRFSCKIAKKSNGLSKEKKYYYVQVLDVLFWRWLESLGLHPHKSKTLGPLKVPLQYQADFLRGCFDGDGCICAVRDKRWRSSWYVTASFASGSPNFLSWLQKRNRKLFGINGYIGKSTRVWNLRYHKRETSLLMRAMYYKPNLPHLERKRAKYLAICKIDR